MEPRTYHDLFITTEHIRRTRLFDLPFNLLVTCTRVGGWELWDTTDGLKNAKVIAGEYASSWLILDVNGIPIVTQKEVTNGNEMHTMQG